MAQRQITVRPQMNMLATTRSAQNVSRAAVMNAGNQLSSQQSQNLEGRSNNGSYHEQYEAQVVSVEQGINDEQGDSVSFDFI